MNKKFFAIAAALAGILVIPVLVMGDAPPDPRAILEKTIERQYTDLDMDVTLVKVSKSGREREMSLNVKIKKAPEVTKTLAVFTAPPEVAGITSLSWDYPGTDKPSDRWFKLSGLDFVKCVGKSCSQMEDRFGFSMNIFAIKLDEANHKLLGEEAVDGATCYKIESTAKDPDNSDGARFITWVDEKMFAARKIEGYDKSGALTQVSSFTGFKELGGHWWETKGEFKKLDSGKSIRFEITSAKINTGIGDDVFERPKTFKTE